tara:strand:- start:114 stop:359 length:246 start_codon:yes stop_codon:yes gene_type:complete
MKKLLAIIVLGLLWSENNFAEITILEQIEPSKLKISPLKGAFSVTRICSNGHEFIVTGKGNNTSTTQVYEERDGKSLPKKC